MTKRAVARRVAVWHVIVVLLLGAGLAQAAQQDVRLLATKVADLLAQVPAGSPAERDRLADQMIALGDEGLDEFTRRLVPAGTGDDQAVRFALSGLAIRASAFGAEAKRAAVERAFVRALPAAADVEVRTFLLDRLQVVGREAAVRAAAPLLAEAELVEPAAQLMLAIRSAEARAALVVALGTATGPPRVTIVKALGELRAAEAHDRLLPLATDPNPALRRAALAALAGIANPRSSRAMQQAAERAGFRHDPSNAVAALLDYARNLGEWGDVVAAEKICRDVMKKTDRADRLATRAAALTVLADLGGHDVLGDLLKAIDHPDPAFRGAALRAAEGLPGIASIRQWTSKAQKVDAVRRAEIVAMLGRQGDRRALPFLRASLGARDPDVTLAAAEALARMIGAEAAPELVAAIATRTGDEARRLGEVLLWTVDTDHLDPVTALLASPDPAVQAAALRVVGARHGRGVATRVLAMTDHADAGVREAAYGALAGVAGPDEVPALLGLLETADETAVMPVQEALVAAVSQAPAGAARVKPLLDALKHSAHPARLVAVLPAIGGPQALSAIVDQFEQGGTAAKAAAFQALVGWRGHDAAGRLLGVVAAGDPAYRDQAFDGFVRQIAASSLSAERKVLELRKALALARTARERRGVLRALEGARTFQAFLVARALLDDPEAAGDAAASVMRLALPTAGARDGLTGTIVREALARVLKTLTGAESDYDKENVRAYLASMPPGEGFVPLFNGRDLDGWQGLVGTPITRATMSPEERTAKQAEADQKARGNWSVRDGAIVFNGTGDNLCSVKEYGDFEMIVDWRITSGGDSGIYLRGTPQVQIWDPARTDVGAEVGSGGLYNNQKHPSKPLVFADTPVGEWNTFRITMVGETVTVFLNGVKVVDRVTMENYWDRGMPIFARGPIELQAHGTDLAFRDLYVREIAGGDALLSAEERAEGFAALFNGRNLDGWIGNVDGYKVEDGTMVFDPAAGDRTNLYTAKEYADFQLRFEFQLTPGANSGVGIRAPREGDAAYVGMEIQVLDDSAPVYASLQPYQYHGSVYGIIPATRGSLKPVGDWNSEEILVRGSRIRVTVNGTVIVDGDLIEATRRGTMDRQPHPGLERASGHIGWLSHDSVVRFRNVRIKDLSAPVAK